METTNGMNPCLCLIVIYLSATSVVARTGVEKVWAKDNLVT